MPPSADKSIQISDSLADFFEQVRRKQWRESVRKMESTLESCAITSLEHIESNYRLIDGVLHISEDRLIFLKEINCVVQNLMTPEKFVLALRDAAAQKPHIEDEVENYTRTEEITILLATLPRTLLIGEAIAIQRFFIESSDRSKSGDSV